MLTSFPQLCDPLCWSNQHLKTSASKATLSKEISRTISQVIFHVFSPFVLKLSFIFWLGFYNSVWSPSLVQPTPLTFASYAILSEEISWKISPVISSITPTIFSQIGFCLLTWFPQFCVIAFVSPTPQTSEPAKQLYLKYFLKSFPLY